MFLLMAEFGTATIKLAEISERYLGMRPATAEQKAAGKITCCHLPRRR